MAGKESDAHSLGKKRKKGNTFGGNWQGRQEKPLEPKDARQKAQGNDMAKGAMPAKPVAAGAQPNRIT